MADRNTSLLGYALLGLLQQQPLSGYDLRKLFSATPLTTFSDSPGSIYPALQRLEKRGLIRSQVQERAGLRRRRLFRLAPTGLAELRRWQLQPIMRDDVIRGVDELMLRFSFMDQSLGKDSSLGFLKALKGELTEYLPSLHDYLAAHGAAMPLSGRLALESGIKSYESLLRWTRSALATYQKNKKGGKKS
jgi:DNA-binding PadR family transcriptional regulator